MLSVFFLFVIQPLPSLTLTFQPSVSPLSANLTHSDPQTRGFFFSSVPSLIFFLSPVQTLLSHPQPPSRQPRTPLSSLSSSSFFLLFKPSLSLYHLPLFHLFTLLPMPSSPFLSYHSRCYPSPLYLPRFIPSPLPLSIPPTLPSPFSPSPFLPPSNGFWGEYKSQFLDYNISSRGCHASFLPFYFILFFLFFVFWWGRLFNF